MNRVFLHLCTDSWGSLKFLDTVVGNKIRPINQQFRTICKLEFWILICNFLITRFRQSYNISWLKEMFCEWLRLHRRLWENPKREEYYLISCQSSFCSLWSECVWLTSNLIHNCVYVYVMNSKSVHADQMWQDSHYLLLMLKNVFNYV